MTFTTYFWPPISGEAYNTSTCFPCTLFSQSSSVYDIGYWRGVDRQKITVIHYKIDIIAWLAPCNTLRIAKTTTLLLQQPWNCCMVEIFLPFCIKEPTRTCRHISLSETIMHERTIREFSDLVVHLCILATMIDVCLCSNVYSPLTSRPQIWPTRERGGNVSTIRRSYVVSFYAWVVKASRCKLQPICLRARLSSRGQVLRTYNFKMKNVSIAFHFQWKIVLSICELSSQGDGIHVQWYLFKLLCLCFLFHVRRKYIIWSFS